MRKSRLERMAAREFLRLPKKEQKQRNSQKRIPTAPPGYIFEGGKRDRRKEDLHNYDG